MQQRWKLLTAAFVGAVSLYSAQAAFAQDRDWRRHEWRDDRREAWRRHEWIRERQHARWMCEHRGICDGWYGYYGAVVPPPEWEPGVSFGFSFR